MPQNDGPAVTGYFFAWFFPALSYDTLCVRRMLGWIYQVLLDALCPHERSEQKWFQA